VEIKFTAIFGEENAAEVYDFLLPEKKKIGFARCCRLSKHGDWTQRIFLFGELKSCIFAYSGDCGSQMSLVKRSEATAAVLRREGLTCGRVGDLGVLI